jgi:hypothetical protein
MSKKQFYTLLVTCTAASLVGGFAINWILYDISNAYAQQGRIVWANSFVLTDSDGSKLAELFVDKEFDDAVTLSLRDKHSKAALKLKPNALWMWNKDGNLRVSLLVQPDGSQTRGEGTLFLLDNSERIKNPQH